METNFNPAGDIMGELYLEGEGGGGVGEKEGTPGVGGGRGCDGGAGVQL